MCLCEKESLTQSGRKDSHYPDRNELAYGNDDNGKGRKTVKTSHAQFSTCSNVRQVFTAYSIRDNWISLRDIVQLSGRHTTSVSWQYIVFIHMAKYNASPRMNTKILAKQISTIGKEKTHRFVEICLHDDEQRGFEEKEDFTKRY